MLHNVNRLVVLLSAVLAAASCGGESSTSGSSGPEPTAGTAGETSTGGGTGQTGGSTGTTGGSAGTSPTAGAAGDTGTGGSVMAGAAGQATGGTGGSDVGTQLIADYLPCETDSDCPVGYGDCVTAVPLNVADGSVTEVATQELFPSLSSTGICSRICTNSPGACSELSLRDNRGDAVPYTCQLIYSGTSPYPDPAPSFPFDDQVDAGAMAAGIPFGAICRPPFGLSADVADEFCDVCNNSDQCGAGVCWDFLADAEVTDGTGSCLAPCGASAACPLGFECTTLADADYCVPVESTCAGCRDLDGDAVGVGQCAPDGTSTAVDCDDTNPDAYYDDSDMLHPFPDHCGDFDYNCNGLSDEDEQSGADVFGAEHCGGCNQACSGQLLTDSTYTADAVCSEVSGIVACRPECVSGYADCDGQLANGCEVVITDPSFVYYPDVDADGDGDPSTPVFACSGAVPADHVSGNTDCDDTDPDINGSATEVCDGKDNDCNGTVDDGFAVGDPCDGADTDLCQNGTFTCLSDGTDVECVNEAVENIGETCDGNDNDCDGLTDEDFAVGDPCDGNDSDVCENGTFTCEANGSGVECVNETITDIAETCDGADNDCDGQTDENWVNLGQACDGGDSDLCQNGTWTCTSDGVGVECVNETVENIAEVCNDDNLDEDCDGEVDEGFDVDGDSYYLCIHAGNSPDCNDSNPAIYPGATEACNGADDDCDGGIDENFDGDGDGYLIEGVCPTGNDCCDNDANSNPGGGYHSYANNCGSYDWNCDGTEQKRWEGGSSFLCLGAGLGCPGDAGWAGGDPGCGSSATFNLSCTDNFWSCSTSSTSRTQQCQ